MNSTDRELPDPGRMFTNLDADVWDLVARGADYDSAVEVVVGLWSAPGQVIYVGGEQW